MPFFQTGGGTIFSSSQVINGALVPADTALTDGTIIIGNTSNQGQERAMSQDVTIDNVGATTLVRGFRILADVSATSGASLSSGTLPTSYRELMVLLDLRTATTNEEWGLEFNGDATAANYETNLDGAAQTLRGFVVLGAPFTIGIDNYCVVNIRNGTDTVQHGMIGHVVQLAATITKNELTGQWTNTGEITSIVLQRQASGTITRARMIVLGLD